MRVKAALFFALLLALLLAGVVERNSRSYISCPNEQVIPAQTFFKVFPDKRNTAAVVDLRIYIDSLYDLDLSRLTFKAHGWLWYNWTKTPMIEGKVDPGQMDRFDLNFLGKIDVNQEISSKKPVVDHSAAGDASY